LGYDGASSGKLQACDKLKIGTGCSAGYGNGSIDAAFNLIAKLIGTALELLRISISALFGGIDSQGKLKVRLKEDRRIAICRGPARVL